MKVAKSSNGKLLYFFPTEAVAKAEGTKTSESSGRRPIALGFVRERESFKKKTKLQEKQKEKQGSMQGTDTEMKEHKEVLRESKDNTSWAEWKYWLVYSQSKTNNGEAI